MADPNCILSFSIAAGEERFLHQAANYEFDLRQFKNTTADFQAAFERAVQKRVADALHPVFIGLSSGYDSGAIQVALSSSEKAHYAYTVFSTEDVEILRRRPMSSFSAVRTLKEKLNT